MKNSVCILLIALGTIGGFIAGRSVGSTDSAVAAVEDETCTPRAAKVPEPKPRIAEADPLPAAPKEVRRVASAEEGDAEADVVVSTGSESDLIAQLGKKLSKDDFIAATNAMSRLREKMAAKTKSRIDYLKSLDMRGLSAAEQDTHTAFIGLLERREGVMAKMKGGIPDQQTLQDLVMLEMQMAPVAKKERSILSRELARDLGCAGEDVGLVEDAISFIYDCTGSGGLGGLGDAVEVLPEGGVSTEATVITL